VRGRVFRAGCMPIRQFLGDAALPSDVIAVMSSAFTVALSRLGLIDRTDPMVEIVARRIIRGALNGERDPERLAEIGRGGLE
jgi:hypothetical protein